MPIRRILHCDMDCFYAAVHMRDDPDLQGRPVVVGGDPIGRGVVAAANYEARKYGIHSAMPAAQAKRLCKDTVFLRPDFQRYRSESEKIFTIYREFTPDIQTLSLDEAYLDVSDHLQDFSSATAIAQEIRKRVLKSCGLTVSVGVGPNKLIAKIASDFNKPDGLTVVRPDQAQAFLAPLPVRRIYGIGPATAKRLADMGITTAAELRKYPLDLLLARFGHWGRTMHEFARGIDNREVKTAHVRKSLSTERTFAQDLRGLPSMDEVLLTMAEEVGASLSKRRIAASTIIVKVRYSDFTTLTRSYSLPAPTSSTDQIMTCAKKLLRKTAAATRTVRLLGLGTSGLVPGELEQLSLF